MMTNSKLNFVKTVRSTPPSISSESLSLPIPPMLMASGSSSGVSLVLIALLPEMSLSFVAESVSRRRMTSLSLGFSRSRFLSARMRPVTRWRSRKLLVVSLLVRTSSLFSMLSKTPPWLLGVKCSICHNEFSELISFTFCPVYFRKKTSGSPAP